MRIICPNCDAIYEVQETLLRPGRATRCARCAHRWVPLADTPAVAPEPPEPALTPEPAPGPPPPNPEPAPEPVVVFQPPPGPTAMERLSAASSNKPRGSLALRLAWTGTMVLLGVLAGEFYVQRAGIMALWPPSVRLYAALGLTPSPAPQSATKQEETDHAGETRQHPADRGH